jgi:dTMP kinase
VKKYPLIVIEGADGAGKGTQCALLSDYLQNRNVTVFDFPDHKSFFGALIGRALNGEFADFSTLSPELASLPYMLDRLSAKADLLRALESGPVLCNRYTTSNLLYSAARVPKEKRKHVMEFVCRAEYEELGLPEPDLVIFLSVPENVSHELVKKKQARGYTEKTHDAHEQNRTLQAAVAEAAKEAAELFSSWRTIDCAPHGELLSPAAIHQEVRIVVDSVMSP